MVRIGVDAGLWKAAREHLDGCAERVGFFLADWSPVESSFAVRSWWPIDDTAAADRDQLHVSLSDETRSAVIQWAWVEDACLIEAHSHGSWAPAAFSHFDLGNLDEWVSHLWWRLGGRPYAAIVTSTLDFDGLAWIDGPGNAEQVEGIAAGTFSRATGATRSFEGRSGDG
ncbi:MAG: hypothetical protein IH941_05175 [Acidobacteria bacterium]|nr:hypothetical protein [Acidobacteriota bacterium]